MITAAADARGQSITTFIADAALDVAAGRYAVVAAGGQAREVTTELVAGVRASAAHLIDLRRVMANASGSLNQLAAAANSGASPTEAAIESALRYLRAQLQRHDALATSILDLIEPGQAETR